MRRRDSQEHMPTRFDLVEWLVVTLILAIAFFAILQVAGNELRETAMRVWGTISGVLR